MKKRTNKASGRKCEIKEETARVTLNLTVEQARWIHDMADRNGTTASRFMRNVLDLLITGDEFEKGKAV